jgi:hypothetical protein
LHGSHVVMVCCWVWGVGGGVGWGGREGGGWGVGGWGGVVCEGSRAADWVDGAERAHEKGPLAVLQLLCEL